MSLTLRPEAAADIEKAFRWYEARRDGLGDEFLAVLDTGLQAIALDPQAAPIVHRDVRRQLLARFPYAVIYRLIEGQPTVVACFHAKLSPRAWRSRR